MNETKIRIHINELGPIRDSWVDYAPLMLFTGASSLGKSYTNFLTYYVISVFSNNGISSFLQDKIAGKLANNTSFNVSFKIANLRLWMKENVESFFRSLYNYDQFSCDVDFVFDFEDSYEFVFSITHENNDFGIENLNAYRISHDTYSRISFVFGEARPVFITGYIGNILSEIFFGRSFSRAILMPPGRSVLIDNTFSVQSAAANMGMYNRFLKDFDYIQHVDFSQDAAPDQQFFMSRIKKLIHGDIINDKEGTKIIMPNGKTLPISAAASSIRELCPLLFFIQNLSIKNFSLCLEEPEAHAHPEMQYDIADLLSACVMGGTYMQITTHSDYMLSRFNQLLRLYKIKEIAPDKFKNLQDKYHISPRDLLNPSMVNAYYFDIKEDGFVNIEKQNLSHGIPFQTFTNVVNRQYLTDEYIEQTMEEISNAD